MPVAGLAEGIKLVGEAELFEGEVRLGVVYALWRILAKVRPDVRSEELVAGCSKLSLRTGLACSRCIS